MRERPAASTPRPAPRCDPLPTPADRAGRSTLRAAPRRSRAAPLQGWVELIEVLVRELGNQVDCRDNYQFTPLHSAANGGHVAAISRLADLRHDLNARDYLGRTPLHYAAMHGRVPALAELAARGADLGLRDLRGGYTGAVGRGWGAGAGQCCGRQRGLAGRLVLLSTGSPLLHAGLLLMLYRLCLASCMLLASICKVGPLCCRLTAAAASRAVIQYAPCVPARPLRACAPRCSPPPCRGCGAVRLHLPPGRAGGARGCAEQQEPDAAGAGTHEGGPGGCTSRAAEPLSRLHPSRGSAQLRAGFDCC